MRPRDTASSIDVFHLRPPFREFWRWWGFFALFPLITLVPAAPFGGWRDNLMWGLLFLLWAPLFFWSGLRPMRVWLKRPKPVWLFFLLSMVAPFALSFAVSALFGLAGLFEPCCPKGQ
jgi:hypothetical protein